MARGRVFLLLGFVLALISAGSVFEVMRMSRQQPAAATQPVMVANVVIPPRTYITTDNSKTFFSVINWPATIVPTGVLTSPDQAVDHVIVGAVQKGEPVFDANLSTQETAGQTGLSLNIPADDVAIAIPVTAVDSAGGVVNPGDFVDILISVNVPENGPVATPTASPTPSATAKLTTQASTQALPASAVQTPPPTQMITLTTLQHMQVLAIGQDITPPGTVPQSQSGGTAAPSAAGATTMTILASHEDALLLKYAKDSDALIDVVLRRYDDAQLRTTQPVDLTYFLNHFGYHLVAPNQGKAGS